MKTDIKQKIIAGILTGSIIINGGLKLINNDKTINKSTEKDLKSSSTIEQLTTEKRLLQKANPMRIEYNNEESLEDFLLEIEDKQVKKFYERLYELYDFKIFKTRSIIPQYFQTIYGNKFSCGTIQSAGCGISSLAMVSSYLFDEIITPDMMTIYDSGPSPATAFEKGIKRLKLNCEIYRGLAAADNLDNALDTGHPVIALVGKASIFTNNGHFIVLAGKTKDGKYIVNDPNIENYYNAKMIDGFTNGFTREEITRGLNGIYIFDKKENFKDMRNRKLSIDTKKSNSETKEESNSTIDELTPLHIKEQDIVITQEEITAYSKPEENSSVLSKIEKDTELEVVAITETNWLLIKYNNELCYIKNTQVKSLLNKVQSLYPELQLTEINIKQLAYVTMDINLRCGNSIEFDAVGTLEKYETIRIIEEYKDWYFVLTNESNMGFIPKKYTNSLEQNCIIADKSTKKIYYYIDGQLKYIASNIIINPTTKDGEYEILNKKNNLIILKTESDSINSFYMNNQNKTLQKIYNETQTGHNFIIHQ